MPIVASFTAIDEVDDFMLIGASNGAIVLYNMSLKTIVL